MSRRRLCAAILRLLYLLAGTVVFLGVFGVLVASAARRLWLGEAPARERSS